MDLLFALHPIHLGGTDLKVRIRTILIQIVWIFRSLRAQASHSQNDWSHPRRRTRTWLASFLSLRVIRQISNYWLRRPRKITLFGCLTVPILVQRVSASTHHSYFPPQRSFDRLSKRAHYWSLALLLPSMNHRSVDSSKRWLRWYQSHLQLLSQSYDWDC